MPKITKRVTDAAAPTQAGKRRIIWDSSVVGFGLLVLPSGIKSFVYDYRNSRGKKRRATIGRVGDMTPDQARKAAEAMRDLVRSGGDPLATRKADREASTVGDVLDAYLASGRFAEKAESTQAIDKGRIKRHLRPLLGKCYVDDLTTEEVRRAHGAIRDGKTATDVKTGHRGRAIVTGGETTARDCIGLFRAIMNWAVEEGLAKTNPAMGIKLGSNGTRDTILRGPDDYRRLFETLASMEGEKRIRQPVADAIRVIALTGCRPGEIAGLRWQHVDFKSGTLRLPPTAHKSGRRTGKPRVIALPATAQQIIAQQTEGKADDFVFAPVRGDGPVALNKPWRAVREEASLPEGIGLHGLRHTMASMLAMSGAQASEIQAALGHATVAMAARYVHWADEARTALAERAAAPALAGMAAASGAQAAEIVHLNKTKASDGQA